MQEPDLLGRGRIRRHNIFLISTSLWGNFFDARRQSREGAPFFYKQSRLRRFIMSRNLGPTRIEVNEKSSQNVIATHSVALVEQ